MRTWTGTVRALNSMFRTAEDGTLRFEPINDYYGTFHPTERLGVGPNACELDLHDGEFFQVLEDTDKSEGRGPQRAAGNFLDYRDAYRKALGLGVQGSIAEIVIMSPGPAEKVTALDYDGNEVVIGVRPTWWPVRIRSRLVFPNRTREEQA